MTLKERLDAVWNMNEIACPMHLCRWAEKQAVKGKFGNSRFSKFGLYVWRGLKLRLKK